MNRWVFWAVVVILAALPGCSPDEGLPADAVCSGEDIETLLCEYSKFFSAGFGVHEARQDAADIAQLPSGGNKVFVHENVRFGSHELPRFDYVVVRRGGTVWISIYCFEDMALGNLLGAELSRVSREVCGPTK